jgi:hypothetical protein
MKFTDNDKDILFSPYIFHDCIREWCKDHLDTILPIPAEELQQTEYISVRSECSSTFVLHI